MWGQMRHDPPGFVRTKLSDLIAMMGFFAAIVVTIALTALGNADLMKHVLEWFGLQNVPGVSLVLRVVSLLISMLISWLLFTWIIARLPRESVSFRSSIGPGCWLRSVSRSSSRWPRSTCNRWCTVQQARRSARCWA